MERTQTSQANAAVSTHAASRPATATMNVVLAVVGEAAAAGATIVTWEPEVAAHIRSVDTFLKIRAA